MQGIWTFFVTRSRRMRQTPKRQRVLQAQAQQLWSDGKLYEYGSDKCKGDSTYEANLKGREREFLLEIFHDKNLSKN